MSDMKAVLISIQPKWCELIAIMWKSLEVRRTRPRLETPFKCYIYQTRKRWLYKLLAPLKSFAWVQTLILGQGNVIGEFVCDYIEDFKKFDFEIDALRRHIKLNGCMDYDEIISYLGNEKCGYGWHISNLKIYDTPKPLSDFRKPCISPKFPYCPYCKVGCEYISETEAEFYRVDGECYTEWRCLNWVKRPPQSWCYVEKLNTDGGKII